MKMTKLRNLTLGLVTAAATAAPAMAETELTYGSWLPSTHLVNAALENYFDKIKADTDGSLTYKLFAGGAMGGPLESVSSLDTLVVDSGIVADAYAKKDLPTSGLIGELITLPEDTLVYAAAMTEFALLQCDQCKAEQAENNYLALAYYATGTYRMMCTSPVEEFADLEGKKVVATARLGNLAAHFGATPVGIALPEMFEALQRGQADCAIASGAWLDSYGLKNVITSINDLSMGAAFNVNVMNINVDTWKDLAAEERQAMLTHLPALISEIVFQYVNEGAAAIDRQLDGMAIMYPADDAYRGSLAEFRANDVALLIEEGKQAGMENPEQLFDTFLNTVKKWEGIVAEVGMDQAAYEAALAENIYSKIEF